MVVAAQQVHIMDIDNLHAHAVVVAYDHVAIQTDSLRKQFPAAEIDDSRCNGLPEPAQDRIIVIEDAGILLCLILCNAFFYVYVTVHRLMAV